jgi:predicted transcriptional regulator
MAIVINLSPELEVLLRDKAARQGQEVDFMASELLASALEWEKQDLEEAIEGIQEGLKDFEAGRFRSFQNFAEEQQRKHNLLTDS